MLKTIILLTLSSFGLSGAGVSGCRANRNVSTLASQPVIEKPDHGSRDLKVLAEGFHSSITEPFVAVIRDDETYDALRKHDANLPNVDAEFFTTNIVVAAFLGERNTGGYSVEIIQEANGQIRVSEKAPGKGVIVPQMITSPFKIISLARSGMPAVSISVGETFHQRAQLYRISSGGFQVSGGFAGGTESFQLAGKLQVTRLGELITIGFAVVGSGASRERTLRDTATGSIKEGRIVISKLSHGSLLDPPSGNLQISGSFLEKNKLRLEINSAQINIPENYSGRGTIEAEMVAASAN